jgi:hypothetical protein
MASATTRQRYRGCVQDYALGLLRTAWSALIGPRTVAAGNEQQGKEARMNTRPRTKSIVTIGLAVAALSLAAPAAGSVIDPPASTPGHAQQAGIVLHRDGSQAAAFVADLSPQASAPTDGDGFNWGAAAIGAGAVLLAAALLMGGSSALGRRRTSKPSGAVSQGA